MSFADFTKEDIQEKWSELISSPYKLILATIVTRNYSNSWQFYFRNKIINFLVPPEVQILTIEFDYNLLTKIEKQSLIREKGGKTVHGIMLSDLQNIIPPKSLCLVIDIDAYPLNQEAIMISFLSAQEKGAFGNIQGYGDHLFIGPSFICFDNEKIKNNVGENAWLINNRSDVGGEITWTMPEVLDQELFKPIKTIFKPIWRLDHFNKPSIGIGTTFGFRDKPMTYHHFYSRVEISKLHFFFVSFLSYIKIKFNILKNIKPLKTFRKLSFFLRHETKYGLKYLRNKLHL